MAKANVLLFPTTCAPEVADAVVHTSLRERWLAYREALRTGTVKPTGRWIPIGDGEEVYRPN